MLTRQTQYQTTRLLEIRFRYRQIHTAADTQRQQSGYECRTQIESRIAGIRFPQNGDVKLILFQHQLAVAL